MTWKKVLRSTQRSEKQAVDMHCAMVSRSILGQQNRQSTCKGRHALGIGSVRQNAPAKTSSRPGLDMSFAENVPEIISKRFEGDLIASTKSRYGMNYNGNENCWSDLMQSVMGSGDSTIAYRVMIGCRIAMGSHVPIGVSRWDVTS